MKLNAPKSFKLSALIEGLEASIIGDPNCMIHGVCTLQNAKPGCITFLMNPLYKKYLDKTTAAAVIVSPENVKLCPTNVVRSSDPYFTYAKIAGYFINKARPLPGVHPSAIIGQGCRIDPTASIGPYCVLGDHVEIGAHVTLESHCTLDAHVKLGEGCYLHPQVTLYHEVILGKNVIVASGSVLGSDGFGVAKHKGVWHKVPQLGRLIIDDDVEIGANCAIDRGAIEDTCIKRGVKLDNHIQIGHNVRIGEHTAMAALVGVSGSTEIGSNCLVGGQTGFAGHVKVADNVIITGGSGVTNSIRAAGVYSSGLHGVQPNREWRKNQARIHRLDKLIDRIKALEELVKDLTKEKRSEE